MTFEQFLKSSGATYQVCFDQYGRDYYKVTGSLSLSPDGTPPGMPFSIEVEGTLDASKARTRLPRRVKAKVIDLRSYCYTEGLEDRSIYAKTVLTDDMNRLKPKCNFRCNLVYSRA